MLIFQSFLSELTVYMSETEPKKIVILAGEPSGDYLGAQLMADMKAILNNNVDFFGIGGQYMEKVGFNSIMPVDKLSVIGVWEAIKNALYFKKIINDVAAKILDYSPDVVITIDFPGFNNRVAKALKAEKSDIPIVHYVAPSVWAWRPDRAKEMPEFADKLLALFPFEPPLFQKYGLDTVFVGHPVASDPDFVEPPDYLRNNFLESIGFSPRYNKSYYQWKDNVRNWSDGAVTVKLFGSMEEEKAVNARLYREEHRMNTHDDFEYKIVTLLPGSRKSEIDAHMPIMTELVKMLASRYKYIRFLIPTVEALEEHVREYTESWDPLPIVFTEKSDKIFSYYISDIALAASGTVTLELARAGLPTVVMYKTSALTAAIVKSLIKVKYVSLVNILLDKPLLPELLQGDCTAEKIYSKVTELLDSKTKREAQKKQFQEVIKLLSPSDKQVAANAVLSAIKT